MASKTTANDGPPLGETGRLPYVCVAAKNPRSTAQIRDGLQRITRLPRTRRPREVAKRPAPTARRVELLPDGLGGDAEPLQVAVLDRHAVRFAPSTGLDRYLKVNTVTRRTHSLYRQGLYWYDCIPNMREEWLRPLMSALDRVVREQAIFREIVGVIGGDASGVARLPYVQFERVTDDGHIAVLRDYATLLDELQGHPILRVADGRWRLTSIRAPLGPFRPTHAA